MTELMTPLYEAGLLQFGRFDGQPFRHNLQMLPSYPQLLRQVAQSAAMRVDASVYDHLLCTQTSLPIAVAISQIMMKPLVYSQGSNLPPARDLVGAYDVGHPALLVVDVWDNNETLQHLINGAGRVGLNVIDVVAVLDVSGAVETEVTVNALLEIEAVTEQLVQQSLAPSGMVAAIKRWLQDNHKA